MDKLPFFFSEREFGRMTAELHEQRRILITGELGTDSLKKASIELVKLDLEGSGPITILLESGGGSVVSAHQFEDIVGAVNSPVDIVTIGDCNSMAVDLIQMCRKRMMFPSSRLLLHYVRTRQPWIGDDLELLDTDIKYFRERMAEIRERRFSLYERRTGLSRDKLMEMFRHGEVHEAFLSAKQAVKLRLADEIITNFKFFRATS